MTEWVAFPGQKTMYIQGPNDHATRPTFNGFLALQFVLARLIRGGKVAAVNESSLTIVKGAETTVVAGSNPDIFLATALTKFCQRSFGRERSLLDAGVSGMIAGLLSRVDRISIQFDEAHTAVYVMPRQLDLLEKVVAVMACDNSNPERIEELATQDFDKIVIMAEAFVKRPFHAPARKETREFTCLRDSVKK